MKTIAIVKYLFSVIGLGMLIGAVLLFNSTNAFLETALSAEGEVVELVRSRSSDSVTYYPVVVFTATGAGAVEFTSSSGSNPASYSVGEIVEVLYSESAPSNARIKGFFSLWGAVLILAILGLVFSLVGIGIITAGYIKAKKTQYLKANGRRVAAKFQSVEINGSLSVNGRNPYQIYAQWKDPSTSRLHIFKSDNIWFDPTDHIPTDSITVLVDPNNPKNYWVDIAFLPKTAD